LSFIFALGVLFLAGLPFGRGLTLGGLGLELDDGFFPFSGGSNGLGGSSFGSSGNSGSSSGLPFSNGLRSFSFSFFFSFSFSFSSSSDSAISFSN
jgi:hypothetical protein